MNVADEVLGSFAILFDLSSAAEQQADTAASDEESWDALMHLFSDTEDAMSRLARTFSVRRPDGEEPILGLWKNFISAECRLVTKLIEKVDSQAGGFITQDNTMKKAIESLRLKVEVG